MVNLIWSNVFDYQAFLDSVFETFLIGQHISAVTRKNYRSDLRNFFNWIINAIQITDKSLPQSIDKLVKRVSADQIEDYKRELLLDNTPQATINRRLSSIRMLFRFARANGWLNDNPTSFVRNITIITPRDSQQKILQGFREALIAEGASPQTLKNYCADVTDFFDWLSEQPQQNN